MIIRTKIHNWFQIIVLKNNNAYFHYPLKNKAYFIVIPFSDCVALFSVSSNFMLRAARIKVIKGFFSLWTFMVVTRHKC